MTQRREEEALSLDEPYELKEKINDVASMPLEGPQEGQQQHKMEHHWVQLMTTYQWNKDEEDLIEKTKKKLVLLLKHRQLTCHMDEPARQLNRSGMATQGRASVVDTVLESSCLTHWNCIYSSICICARNHANKKKERERNTSTVYTTTHTTRVACWGRAKKGRM